MNIGQEAAAGSANQRHHEPSSIYDGLPVAGYQPQSHEKIALVNQNKVTEKAFMSLNRAIFQPSRIRLPGDQP